MTGNRLSFFAVLALLLSVGFSVSSYAGSIKPVKQPAQPLRAVGLLSQSAVLPDLKSIDCGQLAAATEEVEASASPDNPAVTPYPWKSAAPFEISRVDGIKRVFSPGKPMQFCIKAHSPAGIEAVPIEGFALSVSICGEPRGTALKGAYAEYLEGKGLWVVAITPPEDTTISYEIDFSLYCALDESRCAEIYGRAAQVTKKAQFKLESSGKRGSEGAGLEMD